MELKLITPTEATILDSNEGSVNIKAHLEAQAKLTAKQIYDWGNEACPHHGTSGLRRFCFQCWQELLEASK